MKTEVEELKNQLKARNEEIEYLTGWLKEFAHIEDTSIDDIDIWVNDSMEEVCSNLESRLFAAEANAELFEKKTEKLLLIIKYYEKLVPKSVNTPDF